MKNAISATAGIVFRFTRRRCYRALTVVLAGLSCSYKSDMVVLPIHTSLLCL